MNNIHSWIECKAKNLLASGLRFLLDGRTEQNAGSGIPRSAGRRRQAAEGMGEASSAQRATVLSDENHVPQSATRRRKHDFTKDLSVLRILNERDCTRVLEQSGNSARKEEVFATRAKSLAESGKIDEHTFSVIVKAAMNEKHMSIIESINEVLSMSGATVELRIVGESRRKLKSERGGAYDTTLETSIYLCLFDHRIKEPDSDSPLYLNPACLDFRILLLISAGKPKKIFDYPYHGCLACRERIA